jgi:hypothetical protein
MRYYMIIIKINIKELTMRTTEWTVKGYSLADTHNIHVVITDGEHIVGRNYKSRRGLENFVRAYRVTGADELLAFALREFSTGTLREQFEDYKFMYGVDALYEDLLLPAVRAER